MAAGLCSAAGVAASTSLQHHEAGSAPAAVTGSARLLVHLVRRPRWLVAQLVSVAAFCLHAAALRYGSLALVQPVVVSGMVLAVPFRAALSRRPPRLDELCAVLLTGTGLTIFLLVSAPAGHVSAQPADRVALGFTLAALALAGAVHALGTAWARGRWRASLLGIAAGILFGVAAGLLKIVVSELDAHGVLAVVTGWPVWALAAAGVGGSAVNQRAYRAGALTASMPILNVTDVLVSLGFGVVVLGDVPPHSAATVLAQCCALGCVAAGLWAQAGADPSARVRRGVTPPTSNATGAMPGSPHGQQRPLRRPRRQRNARGR